MSRKKKIHLVDFARLTEAGSVSGTVVRASPFFNKKSGGWAYQSFRRGVIGTISGAMPNKSAVMREALGRGPDKCRENNAIVAGMFFDNYTDIRGKVSFLKDLIIEHNGVSIMANNIAIVEYRGNICLIYIQPRKGHCPISHEHIKRIRAFISDYVVPQLDGLAPNDLIDNFDTTLPVKIDVFDTGRFHLKSQDRWPRRYQHDNPFTSGHIDIAPLLDTFTEAFSRITSTSRSGSVARRPKHPPAQPSPDLFD